MMMLVQEGMIALDDCVSTYLPDLPAAWSDVTLRQLLSHTSGLPHYDGITASSPDRSYSRDSILEEVSKLPIEFSPGEKWAYNPFGYVLLGMVIEKVTGKTYPLYVEERILKPLGMTATRFGNDLDVIRNLNPAWYAWQNNTLGRTAGLAYAPWVYTGAGLNSTVLDLVKFDAALYTEKLLKESIKEQMWTPVKLNSEIKNEKASGYALGWIVLNHRGHKYVGHGGGMNNWILRFVDDKLTVIVLCNLLGFDSHVLAKAVADFYLPSGS
jgi:CubicO group peptidase (beta-lactamase class C family)